MLRRMTERLLSGQKATIDSIRSYIAGAAVRGADGGGHGPLARLTRIPSCQSRGRFPASAQMGALGAVLGFHQGDNRLHATPRTVPQA